METIIDKAFARQSSISRAAVISELITLEKEIADARRNMRETWNQVCEAEGVNPKDIQSQQVLEVSDYNIKLAEKYQIFARLYVLKLNKYKRICRVNGIKPDPSILKEVSNNERSESDNRESKLARPGAGKRQSGRGDNKRIPGRNAKKQRRKR